MSLKDLEDRIEKLEQAAERLREETREANSATKALRAARKEVEDLIKTIPKRVEETIGEAITEGLDSYAESLGKATSDAHDHVMEEFKRMSNIMMYGNEKGKGENVVTEWVKLEIQREIAGVIELRKRGEL
jgi:cell division septum initiation protein DivIVA